MHIYLWAQIITWKSHFPTPRQFCVTESISNNNSVTLLILYLLSFFSLFTVLFSFTLSYQALTELRQRAICSNRGSGASVWSCDQTAPGKNLSARRLAPRLNEPDEQPAQLPDDRQTTRCMRKTDDQTAISIETRGERPHLYQDLPPCPLC